MSDNEQNRRDCYKCKFFKITWNPSFPYACKAYGFKGKRLPMLEVLSASGIDCLYFEPKAAAPSADKTKKYPDYI